MSGDSTTAARPVLHQTAVPNRHKLMMLIATAARMGVGLITFVLMARYLGPWQFGMIATSFAYATFIGIATDYGLAISAIRTAAAQPEQAGQITTNALATKFALLLLAAPIIALVMVMVLPVDQLSIYVIIFVGTLSYSFGDLAMVAARARRQFETEAATVLSSSLVMLALVGCVAALTRDALWTACAFTIGRVFYLAATLMVLRWRLDMRLSFSAPVSTILGTLRLSSGYAADSILTNVSNQIDVLMFSLVLSLHDIGIYQSGARLVQVIMPFAVVLSTVYMPALAAAASKDIRDDFTIIARRVIWEFSFLALLGGCAFAIIGPILTPRIYGPGYQSLIALWPGFAAFVVWRFTAAGLGICLVALGHIRVRILSNVANMAAFATAATLFVHKDGLNHSSYVLAFSALPSLLLYTTSVHRIKVLGSTPLLAALLALVPVLATMVILAL